MINLSIKKVTSLDELNLRIDIPTFADIETHGLYINPRLIQLYQPLSENLQLPNTEPIYLLDLDILDLDEVKAILKPLWLVFQGASYDFGTLNMTSTRFDDTLYLARTAYPEWQQFSLDNIVANLGWDKLYEGLDKKELQKLGFVPGAYLSNKQLKYAATDVYSLSLIWQNPRIQASREVLAYKVDILSLKYSIQYQQNKLIVSQKDVMIELEKLEDIIEANYVLLDGLNPNSPKQVKEYLGTESSAKAVLIKLISIGGNKGAMAKIVYDQRRLLKRRTFLHSYNYPEVVTRFNPAGAATGRFTSTGKDLPRGINAQQITRDLQYIFNQDTDDTVVVHADYSTAELRAGCSIMRDSTMYKELKQGIDLHKIAATMALGGRPEDITKIGRQKGKAVSFGFIFGMSAASFVEYAFINYGVIFTLDEAKAIKKAYQTRYTGITKYAANRWNDYSTVPVKSPLGRRNKARLGTDAINYATQACIAETTKLAIHYLYTEFEEVLYYIYNVVHDAIYMRVPKGTEKLWADRLASAMKKGWTEMCKTPMLYYKDIPMPVEVEYNIYYTDGSYNYICEEY